ncbi:conjugal transfer mating pair stabilization protein TraG [Escherichia coli]|nr:conjugal transfer mating pair stabilization protein TraG [Escherichia coli]
MSEDLSQQFAQYVMKHAPQDAEAILTKHQFTGDCRTSSGDGLVFCAGTGTAWC